VDVEDDPDGESVEAAVGELDEVPDEESDGSARASPCPESTATPTPIVMIRSANRRMSRTAFVTRDIWHDNNLSGKRKQAGGVRKGEVLMIGSAAGRDRDGRRHAAVDVVCVRSQCGAADAALHQYRIDHSVDGAAVDGPGSLLNFQGLRPD
jgi:hypothetical protein